MTVNNPSPAQRIVTHEQNIASNIEEIELHESLIETTELAHQDLLAEKTVLDAERPTLLERATFSDRLENERNLQNETIKLAREQTSDFKKKTFELKNEVYEEQGQLKVAHADQEALNEQNVADLDGAKTRSEQRLQRLDNYDEKDPEKAEAQAQRIENEQAVLAKREKELAEAKASSQAAKEAAQERDAKVADDVKEACPLKCNATQLVLSNGDKRAYKMSMEAFQSAQTLHVISLSHAADKKGILVPAVSVISAELTGHCEKGKPSATSLSAVEKNLERLSNDDFCPVFKVNKGPVNLEMPGKAGSPLKFQAFCPDPPEGFIMDWTYIFKNIFLPKYRTPPLEYAIETKGCDGSYPLSAVVAAHPKIKADLSLTITYKQLKEVTPLPNWEESTAGVITSDANPGHRTIEYGNWVFAMVFTGEVDHLNLTLQLEHLKPNELLQNLRKALNLFLFLFDVIKLCATQDLSTNIRSLDYDGNDVIENEAPASSTQGELAATKAERWKTKDGFHMDIVYPKVVLSMGYENCEVTGKNTLGYKSQAALMLDPLIGVSSSIDILSALIKIGANGLLPGALEAGKIFIKYMVPIIKELLPANEKVTEENIEDRQFYVEAGIGLVLDVGAKVTAETRWTHEVDADNIHWPKADDIEKSVSAGGALEMKLEGKVYLKGKAWMVRFEAGMMVAVGSASGIGSSTSGGTTKFHGASKIEAKVTLTEGTTEPMIEGAIEWNGLALLFLSYKNFGISSKDNDEKSESNVEDDWGEEEKNTTSEQKTYQNQWVLIKKGSYPEEPTKRPLSDFI